MFAFLGIQGPNRYGPDPQWPLFPDALSGMETAMQNERPIIRSQTIQICFNVAYKFVWTLLILGLALGLIVYAIPDWHPEWLILILPASIGAILMGLWTFITARSNPLRFLVYRDRLVAEYAWREARTVVSFSDVSSFEAVQFVQSTGHNRIKIRYVRIHMVTGSNRRLDVLLDPRGLVISLQRALERYQRDTGREGGSGD